MDLFEIAHQEVSSAGVTICACCAEPGSHKRGFAVKKTRTVHLARGYATRSTLHRLLHEIGHVVNDEAGMKRWEREAAANRYAAERMRAYGLSIPRKVTHSANAYVGRMARWGRNIAAGRTR